MSVLYVRNSDTGEFKAIKTIRGPQGPAGKDAEVTAESITSALGYTPANEDYSELTNLLHNSNFRAFVAQSGISTSHAGGSVTFAGDRWELVSGTVTATANENNNGFGAVTLNGTIRQIVELAPETGFAYVSAQSGSATATYASGIVTITATDAVLDQAWLYDVEHNQPPARKTYSEEFLECSRYYYYLTKTNLLSFIGYSQSTTTARFTIPLPVPMRISNPSYKVSYRTSMQMYPGLSMPDAIAGISTLGNYALIEVTKTELEADQVMLLKTNATIEIAADLLE